MQVEIPYEIEELARTMGISPKRAANAILEWFTEPMLGTGLLVHRRRQMMPKVDRFKAAVGDYAKRQRLSRVVVMERMIEKAFDSPF